MYAKWKFAPCNTKRSSAIRASARFGGSCRAPPHPPSNPQEDGDSPGRSRNQSRTPMALSRIRSARMDRCACIINPERFRTPRLRKETVNMRRKRRTYQFGWLERQERKGRLAVWLYRYREMMPSGECIKRCNTVGTVEEYPTEALAWKAVEHLRLC